MYVLSCPKLERVFILDVCCNLFALRQFLTNLIMTHVSIDLNYVEFTFQIAIEITDEQLDDTGYNNETAKGDHNDFDAVLRAAVISEKRRSRIVSMSSVTELDRYRTGSMSSMSGRAFAHPPGYGPLQNQQSPSHHSGQQAPPQPKYADFAHLNKAQTAL